MSKARELANLRGTPTDNNVLLHSLAGDAITAGSGTYNVAVGANAFGAGTTGDDNIAIGQTALAAATIGLRNIAIGCGAMATAVGGQADNNIAIGLGTLAGHADMSGNDNIAIGQAAADILTTGACNIAM